MKKILAVLVLLAVGAALYGCVVNSNPHTRVRVNAAQDQALMETMLLVSLTQSRLDVREVSAMRDMARDRFTTWLRTNLPATATSKARVLFIGPTMPNGQHLIVRYPEMESELRDHP